MSRWVLGLVLLGGLAGCAPHPLDYIPPTDRSLLQAEARMGSNGAPAAGGISVDDMLAQARAHADDARLQLDFAAGDASLTQAQKDQLSGFAARAPGARFIVSAKRTDFAQDPALLPQRRAVAVAHVLTDAGHEVDIRFAAEAAPDQVNVTRALGGTP